MNSLPNLLPELADADADAYARAAPAAHPTAAGQPAHADDRGLVAAGVGFLAHAVERDFYFPAKAKQFHSNKDSSVWEMVHAATGRRVVAKGVADGPDVRREVAIHQAVAGHPNILPLLAVYEVALPYGHRLRPVRVQEEPDPVRVIVLVTPRLQSDMLDALTPHINAKVPVSRALLAAYVGQMMAALAHVHERGFTHADVKLENFFLSFPAADGSQAVLLGDFGHAGPTGSVPVRHNFGTPLYRPPEGFASHDAKAAGGEHIPLHPSTDVWALGVATLVLARVVHVAVNHVLPFGSGDEHAVLTALLSEAVWAGIWAQLQQRDHADGSNLMGFAAAALAWEPADRTDTTVLPLALL